MTPGQHKETAPAWLNDSFLENVVQNVENNLTTKILRSDITFDTGIGDHYASTMYKVKLSVTQNSKEGKEKDIYILIKTLPKGDVTQELLAKCEIFSREIKLFSETLPAIRRMFENKNCPYEDIGAKHYYHTSDMTVLVVENLAPKGFRMANRQVGLDINHSMLVMDLLGKYHASSIALRSKTPELIDSYPKHPFFYDATAIENLIQSTLKTLSTVVLSWPNGEYYSKRIQERVYTFTDDYKKLFEYDLNRYNVLIHGDLWMGNMLFRYDDATGDVKEVKFVDFQCACLGSPAIDLQYFIHTSPTEEVRTNHADDLLNEYHSVLCDTLNKLGCPEKAISFEGLMEEYEKNALQSLFGLLIIFPVVNAEPDNAMDLEECLKDNKGDSTLYRRLTSENVTKVFKKYIPVFIEKGLL